MNLALAFSPAALSRATVGPSQAQVNAQVAAGSGNAFSRDSVVRTTHRRDSMRAVGLGLVATKRVLDRAGTTKVAAGGRAK